MQTKETQTRRPWLDAWHVNPSANRDYDFIDGLRGVAILMVVASHYIYSNPQSGLAIQIPSALIGASGRGVMLFFALSGFLISWPFWKLKFKGSDKVVPPGYAKRRFWKIYPPLVLSVLLLTPLFVYFYPDFPYWPLAGRWLAGIPFVFPVSGRLNSVMWTLVIEVQFYAVLPLVFLALARVPAKACLWIVSVLFLLVPFVFRAITGQVATMLPILNTHFPAALDVFGIGILVAGLDNMGVMKKSWARLGYGGLALWPVVLVMVGWMEHHEGCDTFAWRETSGGLEKLASGCLLMLVADPQHRIARLLCAPWLRWCGIVSYEWYLFHQPLIGWTRITFGPAEGALVKYAAIICGPLLLSLLITSVVYRCFSLPILQYGRSDKRR